MWNTRSQTMTTKGGIQDSAMKAVMEVDSNGSSTVGLQQTEKKLFRRLSTSHLSQGSGVPLTPKSTTLSIADETTSTIPIEAVTLGKPKAMVLVLHAYGIHSDQYVQFAKYLTNENFAVATFDLPGHGRSGSIGGIRGYLDSIDNYVSALDTVVKQLLRYGGSMRDQAAKSLALPLVSDPGSGDLQAVTEHIASKVEDSAHEWVPLDVPLFIVGDRIGATVVLCFLESDSEAAQ